MNHDRPNITMGVPVRNGAQFLAETLDSLLAQSYPDFELIISDNFSTDQTEAICRAYASRDPRIRYYRSEEDIGLARNYNFLFQNARGKYFKWAAADDLCKPDYLQRCLEVLEQNPEVVLAYAKAAFIDEKGNHVDANDRGFDLRSDDAAERLRYVIFASHWVNAIFGLIRIEALAKTCLVPTYPSGDYTVLGELTLAGKFFEVPEALFLRRLHPGASSQNTGNFGFMAQLWTGKQPVLLPYWNRSWDHFKTVLRSKLSVAKKISLEASVLRSMISRRQRLWAEIRACFF